MMQKVFSGWIDHELLQQEITAAIGTQDTAGWYLNGSQGEVTFVATKDDTPDPTTVIQAHIDNAAQRQADETKQAAKLEIERQRDEKLALGVEWNSKHWHTDNEFQTQITGLIGAVNAGILPVDATINVRTIENTVEVLTVTQAKQLAGAVLQYVQGVYAWSWTEKDKL